ncbi:MAG: hypothetical protein IJ493_08025 [Clostridia bacterium]|nr:hypothetical protein [Clostridia bacterium]
MTRAKLLDGSVVTLPVKTTPTDDGVIVAPDVSDWSKIAYIDLCFDAADAKAGDAGYYAIPRGTGSPDDHICTFDEREDCEVDGANYQLTMFGWVKNGEGCCAIVTGYTYEYHLIYGVKDGSYYMFPRFHVNGQPPYEEISVRYEKLSGSNADYSGIARTYRAYLLAETGVKPLRERMNPELKYASESLYVRVRMAWKPVPSPVMEQTEENEPPIHVAIDFEGVGKLMERCKAAGVEKAEFCLVGWNKSGHDGRWPQIFPVEPLLGGEEGLRALIKKAGELGYAITCHTNSTDCYSIADCYSPAITMKRADGSTCGHSTMWGGGLPRFVCPDKALEIAERELPRVAELGFRGLHYVDVISVLPLSPCYDPAHPVNRRQAKADWRNVAKLSQTLFGGFSSEGGYDFMLPYLDYGLYISFHDTESKKLPPMFTKSVPLWQIALHGIVMSNPYTATVNSPIKSRHHQLEVIERGGRPTVYVYSKFVSDGNHWMGSDDIVCTTEEDTAKAVKAMADLYAEHKDMMYLQTEFIDRHEEISDGVTCTTYSDGTKAIVDWNRGEYTLQKA